MRTQRFTKLRGSDGKDHSYELVQHPATEGLSLLQEVLSTVSSPIGLIVSAFQRSGSIPEGEGFFDMILDDKVDASHLGQAFDLFVRNVGDRMDLFGRILRYTERDGVPLSNELAFNNAYQGNYRELFQAVIWSLKENFGDVFGAASFPFVGKVRGESSDRKQSDG